MTVCGFLEGLTISNYLREDIHIKRLRIVQIQIYAVANDIFSLKKEVMVEGKRDWNYVLIYCGKGSSMEESLRKCIEKHDKCVKKHQELHEFLKSFYKDDEEALTYLRMLTSSFSGGLEFHVNCAERYGHVQTSIE